MRSLICVLVAWSCLAHAGLHSVYQETRFRPQTCLQRAYQALGFTRVVPTAVDMYVTSYIDGGFSLFDLSRRFEALSKGNLRAFYPDLDQIASLIKHQEALHLHRASAFVIGARYPILEVVSRPVESWNVELYTSAIFRAGLKKSGTPLQGEDFAIYRIHHFDGSDSLIVAFRVNGIADIEVMNDRSDSRPIHNYFLISNGPGVDATARAYSRPGLGHELHTGTFDANAFRQFVEADIQSEDLLPTVDPKR